MEPIIRIEHLTHTYSAGTPFQRSAVEDVSLDIMPGEFLGIIGHTGSGKSTLIQHLNGLLRPTQGRVLLNGKDIWAEPKKTRQVRFQVGLVFQYPEYQLFEETVYKDIAYGPGNMGLDRDEIDRRVRASAALVGLTEEMLSFSSFSILSDTSRTASSYCSAVGTPSWTSPRRVWTPGVGRPFWPRSGPITKSAAPPLSW